MNRDVPQTAETALMELKDVSYSYGQEAVLKDVTFTLYSGDFAGLVGQNGSGKSTLVRLMLGLQSLQRGSISWRGKELKEQYGLAERAALAYVSQRHDDYNQSFPITVEEVVKTGLPPIGKTRRALFAKPELSGVSAAQLIEEAMDLTGVKDLAKRRIGDLSGGQRQRALLARSLASRPQLLILDEPTAGLDARSEGQLYELLHKLNNHEGKTIFLVSHDMSAVTAHSNRMLCLGSDAFFEHPIQEPTDDDFYKRLYGFDVVPHYSHHHGVPHDLIHPHDHTDSRRSIHMEQRTQPEFPNQPAQPEGPRIPDTPGGPRIPDAPRTPEMPDTPRTPEVPDSPRVPEIPNEPDGPRIPERGPEPETPGFPERPETPGFPEHPETPGFPERPDAPDIPDSPDSPTAPDSPEGPEIPDVPDSPIETEGGRQLEGGTDPLQAERRF